MTGIKTPTLADYEYEMLGAAEPYNGVSINTKDEDYHPIHSGTTEPILILSVTGTKTGTGDISLKPGLLDTSVQARSLVAGFVGFDKSVVNGSTLYTHGTNINKSNSGGDDVVPTGRTFVILSDAHTS